MRKSNCDINEIISVSQIDGVTNCFNSFFIDKAFTGMIFNDDFSNELSEIADSLKQDNDLVRIIQEVVSLNNDLKSINRFLLKDSFNDEYFDFTTPEFRALNPNARIRKKHFALIPFISANNCCCIDEYVLQLKSAKSDLKCNSFCIGGIDVRKIDFLISFFEHIKAENIRIREAIISDQEVIKAMYNLFISHKNL